MRYLKFCFLLFMRDFLTTSDLAHKSGYTPQQIRNLWNAGRLLAAEVINPGGKQLRFKKTQEIEDWCANKRRSLPTRPVDYRLWYKLVERCKELEKQDGPYPPWRWDSTNFHEWVELMEQKPARA